MMPEPQIRILPEQVANKIAAGEVVDRPASVVKELIENALDAGATQIDVEIVAGGKKAIVVADNGWGMSRDNALLSIERHATSKIKDVNDIERVATLGFRGEALAAIAAVSRLTLVTRRADSLAGTEINIVAGKIQDVRDVGCPPGTVVTVRMLFFNVPARRRFLRSEQTEAAHVRQVVLTYALAFPEVAFRLTEDREDRYRFPKASSLADRVRDIVGEEFFGKLRPVHAATETIRITGFVSVPEFSRADRADQCVFVNRRPAIANVLTYAISEAYRTLLPRGRYPIVYLCLELDPRDVDVNVHPAKKEVRFRRATEVRDAVIHAITHALRASSSLPEASAAVPSMPVESSQPVELHIEGLPPSHTFMYPRMPLVGQPVSPGVVSTVQPSPAQESASDSATQVTTVSPWAWCRVLGQVGGLFVVMETEEGLVLMDPHAAHERVLFERYMSEVSKGQVSVQGLLAPETVELSPRDAELVRENLPLLRRMGFGIAEFGHDAFVVDAVPVCLGVVPAREMILGTVAELSRAGYEAGKERVAEERIAQAACKAAVKARDHLTLEEIERLVVDLARTQMPYTCPHGRPTLIFMGYDELRRKFGRT